MFRELLLHLCILQISTGALQLARKLSSTDTAFQNVFSTLSSRAANSLIECSSRVHQTSSLPLKAQRASGFIYNKTTSTCTLGRTIAYNDYFINSSTSEDEENIIYVLLGKPLASAVNSDTWFYALFNEEKSAYFSHPNFTMAWPTGSPPNWSSFSYTYLSPVQTYGGMYGMTFPTTTGLKFMANPYSSPSGFTFLVWFRATSAADVPLVCLCSASRWLLEFGLAFSSSKMMVTLPTLGSYLASSVGAASTGQWNYLGVTYDAASSVYSFYLNGTAFGTGTMAVSSYGSLIHHVTFGMTCGEDNFNPGGTLASAEIYMRALSSTEIIQAMAKSYAGRTKTGNLLP